MNTNDILICPVCRRQLFKEGNSYYCDGERRHCFDISASGHTNLCPGKPTGGDDKALVRSRTGFLNLGYYKPIADKVCELVGVLSANACVIDAGCGEGYYTNRIASSSGAHVYGFDLSKEAVISASKSAKKSGISNCKYFVGGIYDLPVENGSADAVVSIFAPCAENEFERVLKNDGRLIIVASGKDHLYGLKAAIYESVRTNEERADLPKDMKLLERHKISYMIDLPDAESIRNLFSMTPYYYRTSEADMQKLLALTTLSTKVEADIFVYGKEVQI